MAIPQHNNGNHATQPLEYRTIQSGIQMSFEYQTICKPDNFRPSEYRTSPVFRWLLYFKIPSCLTGTFKGTNKPVNPVLSNRIEFALAFNDLPKIILLSVCSNWVTSPVGYHCYYTVGLHYLSYPSLWPLQARLSRFSKSLALDWFGLIQQQSIMARAFLDDIMSQNEHKIVFQVQLQFSLG